MAKGNILVAPLNWGMGHATRCIPVIQELLRYGYTPILASDGVALSLLKKEFPNLKNLELPPYDIEYPEDGELFRRKMLASLPKIRKAISQENKITQALVHTYQLKGIISDNRLGVRSKVVPSVIITHQLNVLTGRTTILSSMMHKFYLRKFNECWIPDVDGKKRSLSGKLGFSNKKSSNIKYLGPISRFNILNLEKRYDILVVLSGPEPQRGILEEILLKEMAKTKQQVLFVRGVVEDKQSSEVNGNIKIYNFLLGHQLENAFNSSDLIIARSGYSTIMDLAKLEKKAFLIPTPGQYEQEYLALRFSKMKIAAYSSQKDFRYEKLKEAEGFTGFVGFNFPSGLGENFALFERE